VVGIELVPDRVMLPEGTIHTYMTRPAPQLKPQRRGAHRL